MQRRPPVVIRNAHPRVGDGEYSARAHRLLMRVGGDLRVGVQEALERGEAAGPAGMLLRLVHQITHPWRELPPIHPLAISFFL
jgi:hypothetical protein